MVALHSGCRLFCWLDGNYFHRVNLHTHYVLIHAYLNTPYVQSFDKYLLDENIFVIKYVILVEGPQ